MIWILYTLVLGVMAIEKYGPNKPHMLFQIGQRSKQTVSFGWGYYYDSGSNLSDVRLKYENTKNGVYCNVLQSNGQTHIKQEVHDSKYNLDAMIRYQLLSQNHWEAQMKMNHNSDGQSKIHGFVYMAIENNDYKKVNTQKVESEKSLVIKNINNQLSIDYIKDRHLLGAFSIRSNSNKPELFGMFTNVSDNWNARNILQHLVGIKQVHKYPHLERTTNKQLKSWQDSQVQAIQDADWYNKKYTFAVITFEIQNEESIYVQFSQKSQFSKEFDELKFQKTSNKLKQLYKNHDKSKFLQHVESNLLGGIAYYYGPLYTQHSLMSQSQTFTHSTTPSRLIFPRSFLWDDGFHMMVLVRNYKPLVLRFLNQWMDKIDIFGWIARQQIRGYEISSMMPELRFVFQDTFQQNPPTLMLPIRYLIDNSRDSKELNKLLENNFWKIEKWYRYFKDTQSHYDMTDKEEIVQQIKFRWRCKDSCENGNFMGSGLDDYPRQEQGQMSKQHVDIISWLYFFAQSLQKIAEYIGDSKAAIFYNQQKVFFNETLYKEYLDKDNLFKDIVVTHNHNINSYITHIGYINLFPFLMGMIRDSSPQFDAVLNVMKDPKILWSLDGIRSLSLNDSHYGTGDNYWRGAIWMPINYLILRACKLYYPETTKQFYEELRQKIVSTVERNYNQTGYLFQNYHLGKGNRGFPFYGWTSLVNSIILQVY